MSNAALESETNVARHKYGQIKQHLFQMCSFIGTLKQTIFVNNEKEMDTIPCRFHVSYALSIASKCKWLFMFIP